MRRSSLWCLVFPRGRRTSSSETARSDETTVVVPTASAATYRRAQLATGHHRQNSRWTTPSGPRGSARPTRTETRTHRARRVVSDIAAVVALIASVALLLAGVVLLASMIGTGR